MGRVLDGYQEYLRRGSDPNLRASFEKMGVFSIFGSIDAWIRELEDAGNSEGSPVGLTKLKNRYPDIPVSQLTLEEYLYNRFIAPP